MKATKPKRTISVPSTPLQHLSRAVSYAINFRIQRIRLPSELHASSKTRQLAAWINAAQEELAKSMRADYERQKSNIRSKLE